MRTKQKELSEIDLLREITEKIDKLIVITSIQGRTKEEQIKYLSSTGYSNSEMAMLLAIPKGTVDSIRANMKKGK